MIYRDDIKKWVKSIPKKLWDNKRNIGIVIIVFIVSLFAFIGDPNVPNAKDTKKEKPHNSTEWIQVTRSINSSTFTPSTEKYATLYYTIEISCTATIGGNAQGTVTLQFSEDGGSTWQDATSIRNSNQVSLAIVLQSINTQRLQIVFPMKSNVLCRLVPSTSGTTTITWINGWEAHTNT